MKACPVCGAKSFKDMEVCFGCMHRFGEPEESDFEQDPFFEALVSSAQAEGTRVGVPVSSTDADGCSNPTCDSKSESTNGLVMQESESCGSRSSVALADQKADASAELTESSPLVFPVSGNGGFDLVISIRRA